MELKAILITLLSGLSFFVGYLITRFVKNEKKLVVFSVGFSFSVILGLIFGHLLPESLELLSNKLIFVICVIIGFAMLKLLDLFIPNHDHGSKKHNHMEHIGLISTLALLLHNIIEGTAVYTTSLTSISSGLLMTLGVAFHNIPLGIQISSLMHNKKEKIVLISTLTLSSLIGIVLIKVFNIALGTTASGVLISITLGMLLYISFFELLCEIKEHLREHKMIIGILSGVILVLLGFFI